MHACSGWKGDEGATLQPKAKVEKIRWARWIIWQMMEEENSKGCFKRSNGPLRQTREYTPFRLEEGSLRRGNGPLKPWCWFAFQSVAWWEVFRRARYDAGLWFFWKKQVKSQAQRQCRVLPSSAHGNHCLASDLLVRWEPAPRCDLLHPPCFFFIWSVPFVVWFSSSLCNYRFVLLHLHSEKDFTRPIVVPLMCLKACPLRCPKGGLFSSPLPSRSARLPHLPWKALWLAVLPPLLAQKVSDEVQVLPCKCPLRWPLHTAWWRRRRRAHTCAGRQ